MSSERPSLLPSGLITVGKPLVTLYRAVLQRPLLWYGFLVPLSVTVFEKSEGFVTTVPAIVPVTAAFLLLALLNGRVEQLERTWRASPTELWLYSLVCVIEALLAFYHRSPYGWAFVAGRVAFLVIVLTTAAHCIDLSAATDALKGMTGAVGVISLLTIVQALQVIPVPSAWPGAVGRLFGFLRMPVARTLGIRMTYNRFGVMASIALATAMVLPTGYASIIRRSPVRAILFFGVSVAAVISQTRGVYITVLWAVGLGTLLVLARLRRFRWLSSSRGAWMAAMAYGVLLVLGNLLFPLIAPEWVVNLGYEQSVLNVSRRLDLNALGWAALQEAPLLGIGHGSLPNLHPSVTNIHNHFWEHMVSTGIVGGIPYILYHLLILVGALRLLGSDRMLLRAVAIVLVVSVSATYLAYQFFLGFFTAVFAVICGVVLSMRREERSRPVVSSRPSSHDRGSSSHEG